MTTCNKQVSKRTLKAFAKEEKKTARRYDKLGFKKQARQEMSHSRFFKKELKKK